MKLIVLEVVQEWPPPLSKFGFGLAMPKAEGTAYFPDGRVIVRWADNTPKWLGAQRERRRRRKKK